MTPYTAVRVFSATKASDREVLGETVTEWLRDPRQRGVEICDVWVTQCSDSAFHCLAVTLFYRRPLDTIRGEMAEAAPYRGIGRTGDCNCADDFTCAEHGGSHVLRDHK